MPTTPHLYAGDFLEALKKKHAAGTFKEMVIPCPFFFALFYNHMQ
jgi:hypothetical protein